MFSHIYIYFFSYRFFFSASVHNGIMSSIFFLCNRLFPFLVLPFQCPFSYIYFSFFIFLCHFPKIFIPFFILSTIVFFVFFVLPSFQFSLLFSHNELYPSPPQFSSPTTVFNLHDFYYYSLFFPFSLLTAPFLQPSTFSLSPSLKATYLLHNFLYSLPFSSKTSFPSYSILLPVTLLFLLSFLSVRLSEQHTYTLHHFYNSFPSHSSLTLLLHCTAFSLPSFNNSSSQTSIFFPSLL